MHAGVTNWKILVGLIQAIKCGSGMASDKINKRRKFAATRGHLARWRSWCAGRLTADGMLV
jgi:hypothetical protein